METKYIANDILLPVVLQMLSEGHDVEMKARGSSMLPFIVGDRDSVVLRAGDPRPGAIALARVDGGRFVLHRVISVDGENVILMGDGNLAGTEHCLRSDVGGLVTCIVKPSGRRVIPGDGRLWYRLRPLRRIILGVYRRLI